MKKLATFLLCGLLAMSLAACNQSEIKPMMKANTPKVSSEINKNKEKGKIENKEPENKKLEETVDLENTTFGFNGQQYNSDELSHETVEWLEWYTSSSEDEQLKVDSIPAELLNTQIKEDSAVDNIGQQTSEPKPSDGESNSQIDETGNTVWSPPEGFVPMGDTSESKGEIEIINGEVVNGENDDQIHFN